MPLSGPDINPGTDTQTERGKDAISRRRPRFERKPRVPPGKPHCKRTHARIVRRHRTLVLEQHIHFSYHGGHNHTTGPVMHQTTAPTHRVRHAVAQPSDEELCTFAHASHQIDPEGEKGDILVRARLGIKSLLPIRSFHEEIFNALAMFVEAKESTLKTSTATC